MNFTDILFTVSHHTATITLNRPEAYNAISDTMRDNLREAVEMINRPENDIRIVVITGAGKAFCSGGDIKRMKERIDSGVTFHERLETYRRDVAGMVKCLKSIRQPVIARINGAAYGAGCSIAMLCDIRVAADHAKFGMPFGKRGLIPDWGATYFLPRLVGSSKALELAVTGQSFDAEAALSMGFVNKVVPAERLEHCVNDYCNQILDNGPFSVMAVKNTMNQALLQELDTALEQEAQIQSHCFCSEEHREGVESFLEKRPVRF